MQKEFYVSQQLRQQFIYSTPKCFWSIKLGSACTRIFVSVCRMWSGVSADVPSAMTTQHNHFILYSYIQFQQQANSADHRYGTCFCSDNKCFCFTSRFMCLESMQKNISWCCFTPCDPPRLHERWKLATITNINYVSHSTWIRMNYIIEKDLRLLWI